MITHWGLAERRASTAAPCVATIGNFDGVHCGHRRLIDRARELAGQAGIPVVAVTFDPHPLTLLAPHAVPPRLTTLAERLALLESAGVDEVVVLESNWRLLHQTAEQFLVDLSESLHPRALIEGPTFTFGRDRVGTVHTLRAAESRFRFALHVVDEQIADLSGRQVAINSSAIRAALLHGALEDANAMLGRPYRIVGQVVSGDGRGAQLGFPTANLDRVPHLVPATGVYASVAELEDGELALSAVNVGTQPTFAQAVVRIEPYLLNFRGELRGRPLALHLLRRLRGQQRFSDVAALRARIAEDVAAVRAEPAALEVVRAGPRLPVDLSDKSE